MYLLPLINVEWNLSISGLCDLKYCLLCLEKYNKQFARNCIDRLSSNQTIIGSNKKLCYSFYYFILYSVFVMNFLLFLPTCRKCTIGRKFKFVISTNVVRRNLNTLRSRFLSRSFGIEMTLPVWFLWHIPTRRGLSRLGNLLIKILYNLILCYN
jgi:hypothetical protein